MARGALIAAALAAGLLAGCQGAPRHPVTGPSTAPVTTAAITAPARPPVPAANAAATPPAAAATAALAPPRVPAAAPPIDDDPARLIGLDAAGVEALIGRPGFTRREPPAEVWQYVTATCVLDVVLYPETGVARAAYFEARDRAAAPADARACFRTLLRRTGVAG